MSNGKSSMNVEDHYLDVGGVKTRYRQAGSQGFPVILLHGIGCSVLEWEENITELSARHRVLAVDLLGFGLTEKPDKETYSMRRLAQFTLDFLTAKGIESAHFVGSSMGGRIALECALTAPERVASMVLAAPAGVGRDTLINMRLASVPLLGEVITRPSRVGLRMLWREAFYDPSFVTEELVETKFRLACMPGAHKAFLKTLRGMVSLRGFLRGQMEFLQAQLPNMAAPTLVVWGKQDKLLPVAHAEILKRLLPNVELELLDHCGHLPPIEMASVFNELALGFWSRLGKDEEQGK